MSIIYKYPIELDIENEGMYVNLPKGAKVFSVLVEDIHQAYVYAIVDSTEKEINKREVLWLGTGWELTKEQESKINYYTFLGTYKIQDLVWHFWIEPEKEEFNMPDYPF